MKTLYRLNSLVIMPTLTIIFLNAFVLGCENDAGMIENQIHQIDFEIVILGDDQEQGAVFAAGTDINVALKLFNNSGKELKCPKCSSRRNHTY